MAKSITSYSIIFYGGAEGYQNARAQIQVLNGDKPVGRIRFYDADQPAGEDKEVADQVVTHLPMSLFSAVLDVLRHEKNVTISLSGSRGLLKASK